MKSPQLMCKTLLSLLASSIVACASTQDSKGEPIIGSSIEADLFKFSVISTGCTSKNDFSFSIDRANSKPTRLTIVRDKMDGCRRMPFVQAFEYQLDDVGIQASENIVITNPITKLDTVRRKE